MKQFMFQMADFSGKHLKGMFVNEAEISRPKLAPVLGHHVVLVDRSGSMCSVMRDTRTMVEKVMTVEEFQAEGLLLTLISYSSKGDFTVHFSRQTPTDVLDPRKPHLASIRGIEATCMTSVSDPLMAALQFVRPGETTAISVHTDGYFNDTSPMAEARAVDAWILKVGKEYPNVMVNTICYGYADFKMLDRMSGQLSGKTVVARDVRQVYTALHDTTALLAGRVLPALQVEMEDSAFLAFHNVTQRRINGSTTAFTVRGVGPTDDTKLYRYVQVEAGRWEKPSKGRILLKAGPEGLPAYVYARSLLAAGKINDAKFVISGLGDRALLRKHYKALTDQALAGFAEALEARIAGDFSDCSGACDSGLGHAGSSILELCGILEAHRQDFTLDLNATLTGYGRRSVKKLNGSWSPEGVFVPATTRLVPVDDPTQVSVSSFGLNNGSATINMNISRKADLYKDGVRVTAVAGKKLDLKQIRSYTLVGDGDVNLPALHIYISSAKLFSLLRQKGWIGQDSGSYDYRTCYKLDLTDAAICDFGQKLIPPTPAEVDRLLSLTARLSILDAAIGKVGEAAAKWTDEQRADLAAHDLSDTLGYKGKTAVPYTDRTAAFAAGELDSRTVFTVTCGLPTIVSTQNLGTANAYLAKRYSVTVPGTVKKVKKDGTLDAPSMQDIQASGAVFELKQLTGRMKITAADLIYGPLLGAFLVGDMDGVNLAAGKPAWIEARKGLEAELECLYQEKIRPLAMYIGATGLIPDDWASDVERIDGLELVKRFPEILITEAQEKSGVYFVVEGKMVVGVYPTVQEYSTLRGVSAAIKLQKSEELEYE